jgi:cystathionine beta-lyase
MGKVMPTYNKLITCMAASKTFNMAGLMFSNIIIRDSKLRQTFKDNDKTIGFVNPLSLAANQAAYEKGGEWLEQLKSYLDNNFKYIKEYLAENLPNAVFNIPETTYLAWIDLRKCLPDIDDLATFFVNEAGVILEGGNDLFVGNVQGFIRLNLAMPKSTIEEDLRRIVEAIGKHNENNILVSQA